MMKSDCDYTTEINRLKEKIYDLNVYIAELENADVEYRKEIKELKERLTAQAKKEAQKETPLQLAEHGDGFGCRNYCCPTCGCVLWNSDNPGRPNFEKRCPRCFQRLVWG